MATDEMRARIDKDTEEKVNTVVEDHFGAVPDNNSFDDRVNMAIKALRKQRDDAKQRAQDLERDTQAQTGGLGKNLGKQRR